MRSDFDRRIAAASRHFTVDWDEPQLDEASARLGRRLRRRRRTRVLAGGALVSAAAALAMAFFLRSAQEAPGGSIATHPASDQAVTGGPVLLDGATAVLGAGARLRPGVGGGAVALEAGAARFEVTPRTAHPFRVAAGDVTVEVLGTIFTVERRSHRAHVAVERGRVRVLWPGGEEILSAGAQGEFPPSAPTERDVTAPATPTAATPKEPPPAAPAAVPRLAYKHTAAATAHPPRARPRSTSVVSPSSAAAEASPRALSGRIVPALPAASQTASPPPKTASTALATPPSAAKTAAPPATPASAPKAALAPATPPAPQTASPAAVPPRPRDEVGDLLTAVDAARAAGRPADAVAPLRRIAERHATDARAPLAAFTLGRVLLDDVGDARAAAQAFGAARSLGPRTPLAEDALVREVEAWARAGETARARALAEDYLRRHPDGARAARVRRHAGLE